MAMEVGVWDGFQMRYRMEYDVGKIEMILAEEAWSRKWRAEQREIELEEERLASEAADELADEPDPVSGSSRE